MKKKTIKRILSVIFVLYLLCQYFTIGSMVHEGTRLSFVIIVFLCALPVAGCAWAGYNWDRWE